MRLFKPTPLPHGQNYYVIRKMKSGQLVHYQLPCEGLYTEYEMSCIVSPIAGEWLEIPRSQVGFIFGLRQRF